MSNLVLNPSLEVRGGWTFDGAAARIRLGSTAYDGDYAISLQTIYSGDNDYYTVTSSAISAVINVTEGVEYAVYAYRYLAPFGSYGVGDPFGQFGQGIGLWVDPGDGTYVLKVSNVIGIVGQWDLFDGGTFTAVGSEARIKLTGENQNYPDTITWYVDSVTLEQVVMPVKLAERAIDSVVSLLQSNMSTELSAIDTNRADGVTLAVPATGDYYKRPKTEIAGGSVHVEVYESSWEFSNPYSDSDAQRATYDIPITVRVTVFNRDVDTADTMVKRMRRYQVAVFNCFNKNPTLADSDDATKVAVVESADPYWETDPNDADKITKVRATLNVLVKCEEVQA